MTKTLDLLAGFLGRVFDRIASGFTGLVLGAALSAGAGACGGPDEVAATMPSPPVPHETDHLPKAPDTNQPPRAVGEFNITFYYVIGEDEVAAPKPAKVAPVVVAANDNQAADVVPAPSDEARAPAGEAQLASITSTEPPAERVTLYDGTGQCAPITEVTKEFANELALQGTGKLHDGRVLNVWGACNCGHSPCFKVTEAQWGTAGSGRPLQPFRTIAVDPKVVKLGSLLYVPLLEGKLMPGRAPWGGFVHDGCVIADDTGGHIDGNRIDLFVGRKAYFRALGAGSGGSHAWARHVPVYDGSNICERKGRKIARRSASI